MEWTVWASNLVEEEIFSLFKPPLQSVPVFEFIHLQLVQTFRMIGANNSTPLYLIMVLTGTASLFTSLSTTP